MDYEQKYKEVLEKIKSLIDKDHNDINADDILNIFPELRESEGEKIMEELKALVTWAKSYSASGVTMEDAETMLNWLEKQGQVKESINSQYENKTCKGNGEFLTSEDERIRKGIIKYLSWIKDRDGSYMPNNIPFDDMIAWLERQKPSDAALEYLKENHSPSEVSDFQAAMNIAVAKAYDRGRADAIAEDPCRTCDHPTMSCINFPCEKKQGEQRTAWSEEDEIAINAITQLMKFNEKCNVWKSVYMDDGNVVKFEYIASWLKSIKGRVQPPIWKPSEAQMAKLWNIVCECRPADQLLLHAIYCGLNKLKEE